MKKIFFMIILLLSAMSVGYCKTQPLKLTIGSDKEVYELDEPITFEVELKNISDKIIYLTYFCNGPFMKIFFFENEKGEQCKITYTWPESGPMPDALYPNDSYKVWNYHYPPIHIKEAKNGRGFYSFELTKGKDYSFLGKHKIYMKYWCLTSNTIQIEVRENEVADPIDKLVSQLSNDPLWRNGLFPIINLPKTAKHSEVIAECFKMTGFDQGHIKDYKIIEIRKVKISGSLPDDYFAALVDSNLGKKIVLFQYNNGWWTRVYNQ
ncbi:MAG: hypothetical protein AB1629_05730 [Candidatus Omnitrophota bacterium]